MARPRIPVSRKKPVRLPMIMRGPQRDEIELKTVAHAHLMALATGRGDEEAFLTVCFRILVGGCLTSIASDKEGEEALEKELDPAIIALVAVGARYEKLQRWGVNGDELTALRAGLVLTDELQDVATRRQMNEHYQQVGKFVGSLPYTMKNLRRLRVHREDGTLVPVVEMST